MIAFGFTNLRLLYLAYRKNQFQPYMKTIRLSFLTTFYFLVTLTIHAQTSSLSDVSFMEGRWLGTFNGGPIEAAWIAPVGDNLTGFMRMMKDNKVTMYEMLIFEQTAQGPVVLVKHFGPGLIGREEKDKSDRYKFIEAKKDQALFEKEDALFASSTKNGETTS